MNLSPPTTAVFIISVILAVLAIISAFVPIPLISAHAFWVAIIAYVIYSQTIKGAEYNHIAQELEKHAGEELQHARFSIRDAFEGSFL